MKARGTGGTRERELLRFVEACQRREGRWPSYREIASALGWKSTSTVAACVRRLEQSGHLSKDPGKARSFRLEKYRRSRFLERQVEELPVLRPRHGAGESPQTVWVDRGWTGGRKIALWKLAGEGPYVPGMQRGDLVLVDGGEEGSDGDLVAAAVEGEVLVGFLVREGGRMSLQVSRDPEIVMRLGQRGFAGRILGAVVGLLRRYP